MKCNLPSSFKDSTQKCPKCNIRLKRISNYILKCSKCKSCIKYEEMTIEEKSFMNSDYKEL